MSTHKITVAMITKNEEGAVGKVIQDIRREVPEAEILIVDSSNDHTAEIAQQLGAHVIKQFPPKGYGPAMDLALRSASGDVVVTIDCDDTYPINRVREMAGYVTSGQYDLVDASRLERKPKAMPWINYLANWGFAAIASLFMGQRLTDLHSGMRAYSRQLIHELPWDPNGAALPVELLLLPLAKGKRLKVVFIEYKDRIGQSTMNPLPSAWMTWKRILRCWRERRRTVPGKL